ncbi:MAG: hypothetical protein AAGH64_03285, partial [Planctomycetota bacterium]
MRRRRGIRAGMVIGLLSLATTNAFAQSTTIRDVLASFDVPTPAATPVELTTQQAALVDQALAASASGDSARAWTLLGRVRELLRQDAQRATDLLVASASVASEGDDAWRAAILLRSALLLEPDNADTRADLASAIASGADASAADAWVIADALENGKLDRSSRAVLLRALAELLQEQDRAAEAQMLRASAAELAMATDDPELIALRQEQGEIETITLSLSALVEGVEREPLALHDLVAEALRGVTDIEALITQAEAFEPTPATGAVIGVLKSAAGHARRGDAHVRSMLADHPDHPALLLARTRSLRLLGDFGQLRDAGSALAADIPERLELAALLLESGGALDDARVRIARAIDETPADATAELYRRSMIAARIALGLGDNASASERLLAAHRADPGAGPPLRALATLHEPTGTNPDAELWALARSRLLAQGESSYDARVIRAADALDRGYADIAERELYALATSRPEDPLPARLLTTLWIETDRSAQAVRWLEGQLERRPALSHLRVLLSETQIERSYVRRALATLERWNDDNPGDIAVSLELERVYRVHAREPEQAERLELQRLSRFPDSIDALKRRTLILARVGEPADINEALDRLIPLANRADESLGAWSVEVFRRLLRESKRRSPERLDIAPAVARLHAGVRDTPIEADQDAIRALASSSRDLNDVVDAVRRATDRHPAVTSDLMLLAASELFNEARTMGAMLAADGRDPGAELGVLTQRLHASLDMAHRAVVHTSGIAPPDAVTAEGVRSSITLGDALTILEQAGGLIADPGEHGRDIADALLALDDPTPVLTARVDPINFRNPETRARVGRAPLGQSAHRLSYAFTDDDARSDALSLLGLRIAPNDPTINNDLGYRYADRGENLEEAERMTMIAGGMIVDREQIGDLRFDESLEN